MSANLVCTIEQLYDKATSAIQMNNSTGESFRTTVGVRQGCLLSITLFNIFLNRLGGLSLPRKSVVRLTDRPDMTLDVYRGRKTTIQQQLKRIMTDALEEHDVKVRIGSRSITSLRLTDDIDALAEEEQE